MEKGFCLKVAEKERENTNDMYSPPSYKGWNVYLLFQCVSLEFRNYLRNIRKQCTGEFSLENNGNTYNIFFLFVNNSNSET